MMTQPVRLRQRTEFVQFAQPPIFILLGALAGAGVAMLACSTIGLALRNVSGRTVLGTAVLAAACVASLAAHPPPERFQSTHRVPEAVVRSRSGRGFYVFGWNLGLAVRLQVTTFAPYGFLVMCALGSNMTIKFALACGFAVGRVFEPARFSLGNPARSRLSQAPRVAHFESAIALGLLAVVMGSFV